MDHTPHNDRMMKTSTFIPPILPLFLALMIGCQRAEPVRQADSETPQADSKQQDQADRQRQEEPLPRPELTERQKTAIDTILAAGGVVKRRDDGFPTSIDLASNRVFADDEAVRAVLEFPGLKKLRLAVSGVSQETLGDLRSLTELDDFLLQDAPVTDADLAKLLDSMPALKRLSLRRLNKLTDTALDSVAGCPQLDILALLEMNQVSGVWLDRLRSIQRLRSVDLRNSGRMAAGDYEKLASLGRLTDLKIGGPTVDDDVLAVLVRFPSVSSLSIEDAAISDDGLRRLAEQAEFAARLRSLSLARCTNLTDESLGMLDQLPNLETLVLRDIMLIGSFLTALSEAEAKLLPLKTLVLTNAFLTDEVVVLLPQLAPNLVRLDLQGNFDVTDSSLDVLQQMPKLTDIQIKDANSMN